MTFHFPLTDSTSQTLYIDFCQTFGASHYISRIYSFIRRHHNHLFSTILHSHVSHLTRTGHIDKHSLTRIFLHQRNMFISGSVKNNLRMIRFEDHTNTFLHTHITNHRNKIYIRIFFLKLKTDIMQRSFCRVEHDKFLNSHLHQLTAKFTTNTPCRTSHQHHFSPEFFCNLTKVDIYFGTAQQILNLNGTYPLMKVSVRIRLTDSRSYQCFKFITFTIFQKAFFFQASIFITGKQNPLNSALPHNIINIRFIFKVINRKICQSASAVIFAIYIKTGYLIMCTISKT
ncbi:putative uncharacterized protein [Bacteroides ovatus CAG:22]|nr:putative uncharacterized protein [Bacteroides ovatus CAG:22]